MMLQMWWQNCLLCEFLIVRGRVEGPPTTWLIDRVDVNFFRYGALIGIGCAMHFHTGVQMLNLLVHSKKNAFANGISLAGNTTGAMLVFGLMGYSFKNLHYADSLFYLSIGMAVLLGAFTLLYLVPQRYITEYADEDVSSATKKSETFFKGYTPTFIS